MKLGNKIGLGLTGVLAVPDAIDKSKMGNVEKAKFDKILGNQAIKPPEIKPPEVPDTPKLASDFIDLLYKQAEEEEKKNLLPKATLATLGGLMVADAIASRNILSPFRNIAKGSKAFATKIPSMFMKSKGIPRYAKTVSEAAQIAKKEAIKSKIKNGVNIGSMGVGFGTSAALANVAVHMLMDKHFEGNEKAKETIKKSYNDNGLLDETGIHTARKTIKDMMDEVKKKTASEDIDELYKEAASYAKKVLVEDVAQNAIKSIPNIMLPLGVGYLLNKDLKTDFRKVRGEGGTSNQNTDKIVIEVPRDQLKIAVDHTVKPWKEFFKYELPSNFVRSLTWTLPTTALVALTGRNLRGSGEKMQAPEDLTPIEKGKARISIYKHKNQNQDSVPYTDTKNI